MKNVTISMDEELYRAVRVDAARAGKSMSRHIADCLREAPANDVVPIERKTQLEALEKFLGGPKLDISENGRMQTAEERNARR